MNEDAVNDGAPLDKEAAARVCERALELMREAQLHLDRLGATLAAARLDHAISDTEELLR